MLLLFLVLFLFGPSQGRVQRLQGEQGKGVSLGLLGVCTHHSGPTENGPSSHMCLSTSTFFFLPLLPGFLPSLGWRQLTLPPEGVGGASGSKCERGDEIS